MPRVLSITRVLRAKSSPPVLRFFRKPRMNWFDLAIIAIVVLFSLIGIIRGFIREVLSLLSWILAFWMAFTFADSTSYLLEPYIDAPVLRLIASFTALFISALLLLTVASFLIHKVLSVSGIRGTDRALGGLFGAVKGLVIIAALMLFAHETVLPQEKWWQTSLLADHLQPLVLVIRDLLPPDMTQRLQSS